jgi:hypothetical protein
LHLYELNVISMLYKLSKQITFVHILVKLLIDLSSQEKNYFEWVSKQSN